MTLDQAKEEIVRRFGDCEIKSAVPYKNGFVFYVASKKFADHPNEENIDPLFIDNSRKVIPFNPFTFDQSGYEKAMNSIVYF